jgi:hypothetical protein
MSTDGMQNDMLRDHQQRLAAIEYNLKRLLAIQRLDWELPPVSNAFPPEVLEHLARGDKLMAIKVLTQKLGIGLAEAKGMIDRG